MKRKSKLDTVADVQDKLSWLRRHVDDTRDIDAALFWMDVWLDRFLSKK